MNIIDQKLEELAKLAEENNETNIEIIILSLIGARNLGHDWILAEEIQKLVKKKLMPMAELGMDGYNLN